MQKMRWSKADLIEFAKLRKNYNAKIVRLGKSNPEMVDYLPDPMRKTDIYSRDDFKKMKKIGTMFTERGSQAPIKMGNEKVPKFFKAQVQYMQKVVNAKRKATKALFSPEAGNTSLGKEQAYLPFKLKGNEKPMALVKRYEAMKKDLTDASDLTKAEQYKLNYLEAIRDNLGSLGDPIISMIEGLPADAFVKAMRSDYDLSINFVYEFIEALLRAGQIYATWYKFIGENYANEQIEQAEFQDTLDEVYQDPDEAEIKRLDVYDRARLSGEFKKEGEAEAKEYRKELKPKSKATAKDMKSTAKDVFWPGKKKETMSPEDIKSLTYHKPRKTRTKKGK